MPFSFSSRQMTRSTSPQRPLSTSSAKPRAMPDISARLRIGRCSTLVLSDTSRRSAKVERAEYRYRPTSRFALQGQLGFCFQQLDAPVAFLKRPVDQAKRLLLLLCKAQFVLQVLLYVRRSEFKGVEDQRGINFQPGFVGTIGIH